MKIAFSAFTNAVRECLNSPTIAMALEPAAVAQFGGDRAPEYIQDSDAGELLLRAIFRRSDWSFESLELESLQVALSPPLLLTARDVAEHGIFAPNTATNLADAIGAVIVSGVRALDLNPLTPTCEQITLYEIEGVFFALVAMRYRQLDGHEYRTLARYGPELAQSPLCYIRSLEGAALHSVGNLSRLACGRRSGPASGFDPLHLVMGSGTLN